MQLQVFQLRSTSINFHAFINRGLELLCYDYEQLHSGTQQNFESNWMKFSEKLLEKLEKLKTFDRSIIQKLKEVQPQGAAACHHFLVHLSELFSAQLVVRGKKPNHWMATRPEVQDGFLSVTPNQAAFEGHLESRAVKLGRFKKPVPFNPFPALVGRSLDDITHSYVVIQKDVKYPVLSPLQAIDTTFKCIIALNAAYPPECKVLWRLIQKVIYKVKIAGDDFDVIPSLAPVVKFFEK